MLPNGELRIETMQRKEWPYDSYGVRVTHVATGLSVESSLFLSQSKNLEYAKGRLERMVELFQEPEWR